MKNKINTLLIMCGLFLNAQSISLYAMQDIQQEQFSKQTTTVHTYKKTFNTIISIGTLSITAAITTYILTHNKKMTTFVTAIGACTILGSKIYIIIKDQRAAKIKQKKETQIKEERAAKIKHETEEQIRQRQSEEQAKKAREEQNINDEIDNFERYFYSTKIFLHSNPIIQTNTRILREAIRNTRRSLLNKTNDKYLEHAHEHFKIACETIKSIQILVEKEDRIALAREKIRDISIKISPYINRVSTILLVATSTEKTKAQEAKKIIDITSPLIGSDDSHVIEQCNKNLRLADLIEQDLRFGRLIQEEIRTIQQRTHVDLTSHRVIAAAMDMIQRIEPFSDVNNEQYDTIIAIKENLYRALKALSSYGNNDACIQFLNIAQDLEKSLVETPTTEMTSDQAYRTLECNPTNTDTDIKKAYRELVKRYRCDKGTESEGARQQFENIKKAMTTLKASRPSLNQ